MNTIASWIGLGACAAAPFLVLMASPRLLGEVIALVTAQKHATEAFYAVWRASYAEAVQLMKTRPAVKTAAEEVA